jgi:hypothetical protein
VYLDVKKELENLALFSTPAFVLLFTPILANSIPDWTIPYNISGWLSLV